MIAASPLLLAGLLAAPAGWAAGRLARPYAESPARPPLLVMVAAAAVLFAWAALVVSPSWVLAVSFALGVWLLTLAAVDLLCFRLPDRFTLPLILAGLAASLALPGAPMLDHLAGAVGGYAALALLAVIYRAWRGTDGIGMGDAKLLAAAGAWLGWRPLPSVILIACSLSLLWVAVAGARRRGGATEARIAFGAPLCLAIWIVWLHGPLVA